MKIKKIIEMNLHELIEWGWENGITNKYFTIEDSEVNVIGFDNNGNLNATSEISISKNLTFNVKEEEEITEETRIPILIENWGLGDTQSFYTYTNSSIKQIKNLESRAFYMLNDDYSMTLLWKDEEMVE